MKRKKRMTNGELHRTIDGKIWAEQFLLHCPANCPIGLDHLHGWFANAIMAGFDAGYRNGQIYVSDTVLDHVAKECREWEKRAKQAKRMIRKEGGAL